MKWVWLIVFVFMTLVTMSSVVLDIKRVNWLQGGRMSDNCAWLKAAIWTALLYTFAFATLENFR